MSDIESMKAELEAAGYHFSFDEYMKFSFVAFVGEWETRFPCKNEQETIEIAYAHYQREKKFAAMEALLKDMLGNELYLDTDDRCHPSTQLMGWIRRAEELLK